MNFNELEEFLDDTKFTNLYINMKNGTIAPVGNPSLSFIGSPFYILAIKDLGNIVAFPFEDKRTPYRHVAFYAITEIFGENIPVRMLLKTYSAGNLESVKMQFAKACNGKESFKKRDRSLSNIQFVFHLEKREYGKHSGAFFEFIPAFAKHQDDEETVFCIPIEKSGKKIGKLYKDFEILPLAESQPYTKRGGEVVEGKTLLDRNKDVWDIVKGKLLDIDLISQIATYEENFSELNADDFTFLQSNQGLISLALSKGLISQQYFEQYMEQVTGNILANKDTKLIEGEAETTETTETT